MTYAPPRTVTLPLPQSGDATITTTVEGPGVFVVVGANGSGKTRLGSWIELTSTLKSIVHRLSAQKSLTMPDSVSPQGLTKAQAALYWGYSDGDISYKSGHRWGNNPNTALLNDFDKLLVYLFSEDYEKSIAYRRGAFDEAGRTAPSETKLDIVKRLWEKVLPHRELVVGSGTVQTRARNSRLLYSGSEMSDGERVVFYLIGEAMSAPADGVIIIDEPELHLHKSVQAALWDAIESERPDLTFVYLTHDVEFAASRVGAPKICLRAFDGINWEWYVAPPDSGIPEELLLRIVGSRRPILFVEGDESSLDYFFLRHVYEEASLVPAGSYGHVVHAVATFSNFSALHHLHCRGLVDRDYRGDEAITYLAARGVHVLTVAEIENVLIGEGVLSVVAAELLRADSADIIAKAKALVLGLLSQEKERVISELAASRIEAAFKGFNAKARGKAALGDALARVVTTANSSEAYDGAEKEVEEIISAGNYARALAVYANKGLLTMVGNLFGLKPGEYTAYLKRLLLSERRGPLIVALRRQLPTIEFS